MSVLILVAVAGDCPRREDQDVRAASLVWDNVLESGDRLINKPTAEAKSIRSSEHARVLDGKPGAS